MNVVRWDSSTSDRRTSEADIDVWVLDLDLEDPTGALRATLSPDERRRAARFRWPSGGGRWATGRACLRKVLGSYLASRPEDVRFRYETLGRPVLDPSTELSFSVAHAGSVGLVGVTRGRSIGLDIEPLSAASQIADIAEHYLPPDRVATIRASPLEVRDEGWVGLWTEIEACAKVDGRGLTDLTTSTAAQLLDRDLHRVRFGPTLCHLATLAYDGQAAGVSYLAFAGGAFDPSGDRPPL
jgi:4'-phosphopantetheinyl transferase